MFDQNDIRKIEERGSSVSEVEAQVERFRKGFPWLDIVAPATPGNGIKVLGDDAADRAVAYYENASVAGKCKFVPASGAASRMFKDIFAGLAALDPLILGRINIRFHELLQRRHAQLLDLRGLIDTSSHPVKEFFL